MNQENRDLFLEHARKVAPREACGLVVIEKGRQVLVICENIAVENNQFELRAEDYAKAENTGEVIAVVHSHPVTNPLPSQADLVACEASALEWHIVAVITGQWHSFKPTGYKAPLVGREWAHGVMDCYSIVRDHFKEALGFEIPDFDRDHEWWTKGQNIYIENFEKAGFAEVKDGSLRKHDVILMQVLSPVTNHAAVYLGNDVILHHISNRLSTREIYGGMWQKFTTKVVRFKLLENG
jgi:proteasome lid subunit RPN8/RPN11